MPVTKLRRTKFAGGLLALAISTAAMPAQLAPAPKPMTRTERADLMESAPVHTFYLKNSSQPNDSNEILTGLRLMLDPGIKIYLTPKDNAILIKALPDDLATAAKLIAELDRPRPSYRLTYTVDEMDGGKKLKTQTYAVLVAAGQRTTLKEGSKIAVSTGKFDVSSAIAETQMTYLDVGLNFDSTLTEVTGGVQLTSKVEQSSVAPGSGQPLNPSVNQIVITGVANVPLGKAVKIGSLDVPDSTRHLDIEATVEAVP